MENDECEARLERIFMVLDNKNRGKIEASLSLPTKCNSVLSPVPLSV